MLLKTLHKGSLDRTRKDPIGSHHGRGRAPTTSRHWTDKNFSTHGTRSTFENTTSRDDVKEDDVPLFPSLFNFTATSFLFRQVLLQYFYCLFKPNRASTFLQTRALIF